MSADPGNKVQLSCINPLEKKAWNSGEAFFQELKGGYTKDFPITFCRQQLLAQKSDYLLEKLGELFAFEMQIGYNGKVWIKGERIVDTMLIFNALQRIVDKIEELGSTSNNCYQNDKVKAEAEMIISTLEASRKNPEKK